MYENLPLINLEDLGQDQIITSRHLSYKKLSTDQDVENIGCSKNDDSDNNINCDVSVVYNPDGIDDDSDDSYDDLLIKDAMNSDDEIFDDIDDDDGDSDEEDLDDDDYGSDIEED